MSQVYDEVSDWIADDPDPATRAELVDLLERANAGQQDAADELADRFKGLLEFGTAGLRGALGGGPNRMNRVVVIRAAAGLTSYLQETLGRRDVTVVIGFDARHNSDVFARDTAAVVTAAGGRALVLSHPLPTPLLAFAIRFLAADAGVMVTASHNPPQDNGYKVYLGDGSQIVPPADEQIAAAIDRFPRAAEVALAQEGWESVDDSIIDDYLASVTSVVAEGGPRELKIVHTALHGVGSSTMLDAFARAGFADVVPVGEQQQPDPEFPTVSFPNPEEPGAIDLALASAREVGADIVIANDPDADRCAVAIEDSGQWRMLRGDEVGSLLGHHLVQRGVPGDAVFANSIVSSRMLGAIARAAGLRHEETLTGFKWISRVPGLRYGYEEALGYCVDPTGVRDKDGISAALLVAELAAGLKADGRTITDVLTELAQTHGSHLTDSFSVRVDNLSIIGRIMDRLRAEPPSTIAGQQVSRMDDLALGSGELPPTEGLRYYLADDTRIIVRPSGTEPKLKIYLEAIGSAPEETAGRLSAVRAEMEQLTRP
ncbi:phospho-sugar mutase [Yimella sp. cx-51]|uniref:phospho-sugar mutase n=1 Tax=Yimella sp. cx-51 TaxID=2770551 RepID=UPI00165D928A|nr:phospho-sugar mutase [Yimella sp. cx-51]MBC9958158.1 phospho-sugar mutase [Yimella sp. cx-51]QTH38805.1 phospho-sugar mutase [Yimella sp. cx-51]